MNGFLPDVPPLDRLPSYYEEWESIIDELSTLITDHQLRIRINALPLLLIQEEYLPTDRHWQRACCVLTFLSQGYLWERGEEGTVTTLPKQLAIPWWEVSNKCGLPPVLTHSTSVLWNWSLKDPKLPISIDNVVCPFSFTSTKSEEWFSLIPLLIEYAAVPGIKATTDCLAAVKRDDITAVIDALKEVLESLTKMASLLIQIYDELDPGIFYSRIRPFIGGSKNLLAFSNGLIYEGVSDVPKQYSGLSAAQSSTIPVFDILLGIEHYGVHRDFLNELRWHMPRQHRQFLLSLSLQPSLREYVLQHQPNNDLITVYNGCVKELLHFRNDHVILVTRYVVAPSHKVSDKKEGSLATRGTAGGPDFMGFIKSVRDDTKKCLIQVTK